MIKPFYDVRWHDENSHMLGSTVIIGKTEALDLAYLRLRQTEVTTVVVWLNSKIELTLIKKGSL